jgi:dihydrofolate synthase / folylpolyglutamate synthase
MSYATAVEQLNSLGLELVPAPVHSTGAAGTRRKFDLAHMRVLAAALGDPQLRFAAVLVAGTNGKGSTAATLASIMVAAGYRTALYTSPHLVRVNERIQVSAADKGLRVISDEDFARLYFRVDEEAQRLVEAGALPQRPSYFEVLTALAFCYFAEQEVEIAIIEVGLGGRLDATNIIEPILSVITDIALDHMDYLGSTIAEIAREKAGILRANGTLVTLPQHPEANQAIGEAAATLNLRAVSAADYIPLAQQGAERAAANGGEPSEFLPRNHYSVKVGGAAMEVDSPLPGQHQQRNIALAIAAAEELRSGSGNKIEFIRNQDGYNIANTAIEEGIRNTSWPGRLELFDANSPQILLDVAHNPAGAWTLRAAIAQLPEARPRTLLFSCLRDKSLTEMARILLPLFDSSPDGSPSRPMDHIIFAPIDSQRAMPVEELVAAAKALDIPATAVESVADGLELARKVTPADGLIIATGSVYLVGQLRQLIVRS